MLLRNFEKFFSNEGIRHLLMNWSETESGRRHPSGPVGWMIRDQGQLDLYAGKTKLLLGLKGELVTIASRTNFISEQLNITPRGIENLRILGKNFAKELFYGQKVLAVKPGVSLVAYKVIGPETKVLVNGQIGEIINAVPMPIIFDERLIFEQEAKDLPIEVEIYNFIDSYLRKK